MRSLAELVSSLTESIKINCVTQERRNGRTVWFKRRRWTAAPIMFAANNFFRLAGAPVRTLPDLELWQEWEVACFRALHEAEGYEAFAEGVRAVGAASLPGRNLTHFLDGGTLTPEMTAAAARELCRAHALWSPQMGALWSHGDPHAGNFIYDEASQRARLIDFEVMHDPALPAARRQADDLLVFLQDMAGRIAAERWLPCARAFLAAYDRPEALALLRPMLEPPRCGFARLWWAVRTTFLPGAELRRRMAQVRALELFAPVEKPALLAAVSE